MRSEVPASGLLHERFAEVTRRDPGAVAVVGRDGRLTYGELAGRAYQVAHRLLADGIRPDDVVAVLAEPDSLDAVVGVCGVWAAGAGCLPVDPATNPARLARMLAGDGGSGPASRIPVRALVGAGRIAASHAGRVASAVLLDRDAAALAATPSQRPETETSPDNLAYVIHTSGSTGEPKAVAVTHRAIVATYDGWAAVYGLGTRPRTYVQVAGPAFDVYVGDIVRTLLSGDRLALCDTATALDPPRLCALVERSGADSVELTPTVLRLLLSWVEDSGRPMPALSLVVVGGEAWPVRDCRRLRALLPEARIVNTYGIAETTIDATFHDVTAADVAEGVPDGDPVPIGRPFPHLSVSILDRHLRPVRPGVAGEIHVHGPGLAHGYLDRLAATAERFVPAAGGPPGARMYRTGDLARRRPDGALEFVGRVDDEVKVRGVRGSLGAVEAALRHQPEVAAAAVVRVDRGGETVLAGHVVPAGTADGLAGMLRARLADLLPAALVPATIEVRDALPVAPSGKLDRRALAPPDPAPPAPAAGVERQDVLGAVWTRLLGRPPRDPDEDFFAAGGTSLTAALLARQVRSELGVDLPVAAVFATPTLAGLARHLGGEAGPDSEAIADVGPSPVPLAPGQERLWLLHQMRPLDPRYHLPTLLRLRGPLHLDALRAAFAALVERHEALRTRFGWDGDRSVQIVDPAEPVPIEIVEVPDGPATADPVIDDRIRRPFDLAAGPPLRVVLIRYAPERHDLLFVVHHILFDGWSERVLLRELGAAYDAYQAGRIPDLPPLPARWAAVAAWQARRQDGGAGAASRQFWRDNLADPAAPVDLPGPGGTPSGASAERRARIGAELGGRVARAARDSRTTPSAVLLAVLAGLLARWSGRPDLVIGAPFADRGRAETEHLVGFLVNTLPLRLAAPSEVAGADLIRHAGEVMASAAAHGDVPFDQIVADSGHSGAGARSPVFRVWLNLLGEPAAAPPMAGLDVEITDPRLPGALFDVSLYVNDRAGGYDLRLVHDRAVLDAGHAAELLDQYVVLLDGVCAEPTTPIGTHDLLTPAGRSAVPPDAEPYAGPAPGLALGVGLAGSFGRHAGRTAVREGGRETSYREIRRRAASVAAKLAADGVGPGHTVPVYAARTGDLVAAILGVHASGAAFSLLDPDHPAARNAAQVAALAPPAGITLAGEVPAALRAACPRWLTVGGSGESGEFPAPAPAASDGPLYVAFTSGTGGSPVGVRGAAGPVAHFLRWYTERFGLAAGDRFALLSGLSHDPLLRDVLAPLWVGATLCVPPPGLRRSPVDLRAWLAAERVTVLHLTPPLVRLLTSATGATAPDLRLLVIAGEVLRGEDLPAIRAWAPAATVGNGYGTTETPQLASLYVSGPEAPERGPLPVGQGVPGSHLLVRRPDGREAGIGELGRVIVRGPHLALGYLGAGSDRFTGDPVAGHRCFDTGDLGRRGPDGAVTVVTRDDGQVKVRGVRVELAEVDRWLRTLPGVRDAAAAVRRGSDGENELVAALVAADGQHPPDLPSVRGRLRAQLPEPMLPRGVAVLPALPLTPNGKVDRPAIARIPPPRPVLRDRPAGSGTGTEALVSGVWQRLLGLDEVDPTANFFDLGGSSMLVPRAQMALAERLGRTVPVAALFEHPTVRGLARYLSGDTLAGPSGSARPGSPEGRARLRSLRLAARSTGDPVPRTGGSGHPARHLP